MELKKKLLLLKGVGKVLAVVGLVFLVVSLVIDGVGGRDLSESGEFLVNMFVPGLVMLIAGSALYLTGYFMSIVKG